MADAAISAMARPEKDAAGHRIYAEQLFRGLRLMGHDRSARLDVRRTLLRVCLYGDVERAAPSSLWLPRLEKIYDGRRRTLQLSRGIAASSSLR